MSSFKTGQRAKCVVSTPWYADGVLFQDDTYKDRTGTLVGGDFSPGEVAISWDDDSGWDFMSEECLELIDTDATSINADDLTTNLEVRVQARIFIGDVEITDVIKGLIKG